MLFLTMRTLPRSRIGWVTPTYRRLAFTIGEKVSRKTVRLPSLASSSEGPPCSVATLEIMAGLFGLAVMTGLIFVRFSRPTARIKFSNVAVVAPFNGFPTLMIRLANQRNHAMVEAEFRLLFMCSELTKEGEEVRRFYPLRLQFDHLINFPAALTLRHVIDETSPLFGLTPEDLKLADSRMLASIVCVDPVIQAPVQSQTEYLCEQIAWNRRFAEIYTEDSIGRYTVDYSKFHDTVDLSP
jgi:inward rectifier potassium channel